MDMEGRANNNDLLVSDISKKIKKTSATNLYGGEENNNSLLV